MHTIEQFCNKIDSIKKMADDLIKTPPSDNTIRNKIELIQSDCLLVAKGKVEYEKPLILTNEIKDEKNINSK